MLLLFCFSNNLFCCIFIYCGRAGRMLQSPSYSVNSWRRTTTGRPCRNTQDKGPNHFIPIKHAENCYSWSIVEHKLDPTTTRRSSFLTLKRTIAVTTVTAPTALQPEFRGWRRRWWRVVCSLNTPVCVCWRDEQWLIAQLLHIICWTSSLPPPWVCEWRWWLGLGFGWCVSWHWLLIRVWYTPTPTATAIQTKCTIILRSFKSPLQLLGQCLPKTKQIEKADPLRLLISVLKTW